MFTQLTTIEELKQIFVECLINQTNAVTKVSDMSVLNGVAFGSAKLAQKAIKDIAILEGHMFPDVAYGNYLDDYARLNGVGQRFGANQSSTYVRVVGAVGTSYIPGTNVFVSTAGVQFDLENPFVIGSFGFGYVKVRSQTTGSSTQVDPLTITTVTNPPAGHQYCINEYKALFGIDAEDDDTFRQRVKQGPDLLSRGTLDMLTQVFTKINQNVLQVFYTGRDPTGKIIISILSVDGIDLNASELNDILVRAEKFLSISEMRSVDGSGTINMVLQNVSWQPIDISFRANIDSSYNPDDVRKNIQVRISKYLDYRYWQQGQNVYWSDLLDIVKYTAGVQAVNDNLFFPNADVVIDSIMLPRLRGFLMLDMNGNIIEDFQGSLNPIYYPSAPDFSFIASALQNI
jgi:uncharacterized phage protein gp47/JayE